MAAQWRQALDGCVKPVRRLVGGSHPSCDPKLTASSWKKKSTHREVGVAFFVLTETFTARPAPRSNCGSRVQAAASLKNVYSSWQQRSVSALFVSDPIDWHCLTGTRHLHKIPDTSKSRSAMEHCTFALQKNREKWSIARLLFKKTICNEHFSREISKAHAQWNIARLLF